MKKCTPTVLMLIFLIVSCLYANKKDSISDSTLFVSGEFLGYLNNLEYFNDLREGEPFWGAYINSRLCYRPHRKFIFSAGIHLRKDFGDESFLSKVFPLFQAVYIHKDFHLVFGELFSNQRHGLLDALLKEQYRYNPVIEEGIQIYIKKKAFTLDVWGNYPALNTPEHREHLCVGTYSRLAFNSFTLSSMSYLSHYGGQLYAPPGDPVRENVCAALSVSYRHDINGTFEEVGLKHSFLGSYTSDTTSNAQRNYDGGWGSLSRVWCSIRGVKIGISFFKGADYTTWEGNPMYQSDEPYYFIDVHKSFTFGQFLFIDFGARFDFLDMYPHEYFENGDNQIWFHMGYTLKKKIK